MPNSIELCQLSDVQNAIRGSDIGVTLGNIVRWTRFHTEAQCGGETLEEWVDLLGPTAIVLTHQEHFVEFVLQFTDLFGIEDEELFILAAAIHDIGEAAIGDISAQVKSEEDELEEVAAARVLIDQLAVSPECKILLLHAYNQVIAGKNAELQSLFKTLERLEYLDTGLHVARQLNAGRKMKQGWYLVAKVLAFDLSKILIYREAHRKIVDRYLAENSQTIDSSFEQSAVAVDNTFEDRFLAVRASWESWKQISYIH